MSVQSRRSLIERRITTGGEVDFTSLSEEFGVSEMTIRRDVDALEARGLVRRVPGGAIAMKSASLDTSAVDISDDSRERRKLAERALREISPESSLWLTPGPINRCIAAYLASSSLTLTVVTADIKIAYLLTRNPNCQVFMLGGRVDSRTQATVSPAIAGAQPIFHCDLAIIDGVALDASWGATIDDPDRGSLIRDAAGSSTRLLVVAEGPSVGRVAFTKVCSLEDLDVVVLPAEEGAGNVAAAARRAGVRLLTAEH